VLGAELRGDDPEGPSRYRFDPGNSELCFVRDGPIEAAAEHLESHGVPVEEGLVPRSGLLEFISYE
jgi:hypothetical protein